MRSWPINLIRRIRLCLWLARPQILVALGLALAPAFAFAQGHLPDASDNKAWNSELYPKYFSGKHIKDGRDVIRLDAPHRAEDPAVVPITITDLLAGKADQHISQLWLVIDNNPRPMSAHFEFGPAAPNATLSTRVRVNTYTNMRVIAETSDHKFYMVKRFVKASGGCSAPVSRDPEQALKHMGEMRLRRLAGRVSASSPQTADVDHVQLMIRHPNITGLQMNQVTMLVQPPHFVDAITVHKGQQLVFDSQMTFSLSENPSLRFSYVDSSQDAGKLSVRVHDNKNNVFTDQWTSPDVHANAPRKSS